MPLIPSFAYTAHNSQGISLNSSFIDLSSDPSITCAYVMLSCLHSLDGLKILWPFSFEKCNKHGPEEMHAELKRLDALYQNANNL